MGHWTRLHSCICICIGIPILTKLNFLLTCSKKIIIFEFNFVWWISFFKWLPNGANRDGLGMPVPEITRPGCFLKLPVPVSYIPDLPLPARSRILHESKYAPPDKNYASPSASGQQRTFYNKAQLLFTKIYFSPKKTKLHSFCNSIKKKTSNFARYPNFNERALSENVLVG